MVLWLLLGTLYVVLFFMLGLATLRKGHYVVFFVGIVFPVPWIIGAIIGSRAAAETAAARWTARASVHTRERPSETPRRRATSVRMAVARVLSGDDQLDPRP